MIGRRSFTQVCIVCIAVSSAVPHGGAARASTFAVSDSAYVQKPTWALVLSGGIARGFAHIGVIRALEEDRMRPDLVVGTSMGGLVGALYAAGYSPEAMLQLSSEIDLSAHWDLRTKPYRWRATMPVPLVKFVRDERGLQLPVSFVDESELNGLLVELFINAEAMAQGDFDRLPIPFRAVATDVNSGRWALIGSGSLARASRITVGLPMLFAGMGQDSMLLVDGGMSSNLPIEPARHAGAERVLAVDVALPYPHLDETSSGIAVFLQLFDILNKRGQNDTISVAAGDELMWLQLPNSPAADFSKGPDIVAEGYEESRDSVAAIVRKWKFPPTTDSLSHPRPLLPPLASQIEWATEVQSERTIRRALGAFPQGELYADQLLPSFTRLRRAAVVQQYWPEFRVRGDSTVLRMTVRQMPDRELGLAFAAGTDEGARGYLRSSVRPRGVPLPSRLEIGGGLSQLGWSLDAVGEPYALDRGGSGWFVRAHAHRRKTRIFVNGDVVAEPATRRGEYMGGLQVGDPRHQMLQVGAGWAHFETSRDTIGRGRFKRNGLFLAASTEAVGRHHRRVRAEWMPREDGYVAADVWFDYTIKFGSFLLRPGVEAGIVDGDAPLDAYPALGGIGRFPGLRHDEWLGRRTGAVTLRAAYQFVRGAEFYVMGAAGAVKDVISNVEFGEHVAGGGGIGVDFNIGPGLKAEWGITEGGRNRFDILFGERF